MGISKTLLYPFSANSQYFEGYAWAVELALRLKAKLQLFTTVASEDTTSTNSIYQSLLAAHGYYLHHFRHDTTKQTRIIGERFILTGEIQKELMKYLKHNPVDIMIIDPVFQSLHTQDLKEIIRESSSAIILSGSQSPVEDLTNPAPSITEYFYNQLRQAEFYKIPDNFFGTLGHDHTIFNYLRKLFHKNRA